MSLIAVVPIGNDVHLVPREDWQQHQLHDRFYCACSPNVAVIEPDSFVVKHWDFSLRNVARVRRIYEP